MDFSLNLRCVCSEDDKDWNDLSRPATEEYVRLSGIRCPRDMHFMDTTA